jgi:hypothetical protein
MRSLLNSIKGFFKYNHKEVMLYFFDQELKSLYKMKREQQKTAEATDKEIERLEELYYSNQY